MKPRVRACLWLVSVFHIVACVGTTVPVTVAPVDTPQIIHPTTAPQPSPFIQPTPVSDPSIYGNIQIKGAPEFITQTRAALALLEQKDTHAFTKVQTYVGIIEQGEHSGMWAWEFPPRYEVGDVTAFYSVTWYASTIAHDATHSELYARYQAEHPGETVPPEAFSGVEIEKFCNGYQLEVLKRIGAPQAEIDYMSTLDGTHCDVDKDGDCDWDDYQKRDW
ncbi:MAG: hypothetical protein HYZ23_01890 [Chloroflexi bacterium]|nr:hypothetical protein [Chloroflexota bacterium]